MAHQPWAARQTDVDGGHSTADGFAARNGMALIAVGVAFYAVGPVLARSSETTGVLISFWRLWFGAGAFVIGLAIHRLSGRSIGTASGLRWAILAGFAFSCNQVLFFTAIKRTTVVDASLMSTLSPIIVAAIAVPLFGERPGVQFRLWSLVAIAGAVFVVLTSSTRPDGDLLGMLMAVGSTAAFACFFVISKHSRAELPVVGFLTVVMTTAAILVSLFIAGIGESPLTVGTTDLWRALGMAIIPGALGHIAMTWPLRYIPANIPPLMRLGTPIVSGFLAWIFLGEGASWVALVGGALILGGLAGAIRSRAGQDLVASAKATSDTATSDTADNGSGRAG